MLFNDILNLEAMKYWQLPLNASQTQKQKLAKAIEGNDYLASLKIDGALYRLVKNNEGQISLLSRTKSVKTGEFVDKIENVPHIKSWAEKLPNNTILCGEICLSGLKESKSSEITKFMGSLPAKAIARQQQQGNLTYYVFDVLFYNGENYTDLTNDERITKLENLSTVLETVPEVKVAKYIRSNIAQNAQIVLENGYEGLVLLRKNAKYMAGRKAWDTIKIKKELMQTADVVIIGYKKGEKNYTGKSIETWTLWEDIKTGEKVEGLMYGKGGFTPITKNYFYDLVAAFEIGVYKNGELVSVGFVSGLTDEVKFAIKNGENYVGRTLSINAMSFDPISCAFRHPKIVEYRTDKDANECDFNQIM